MASNQADRSKASAPITSKESQKIPAQQNPFSSGYTGASKPSLHVADNPSQRLDTERSGPDHREPGEVRATFCRCSPCTAPIYGRSLALGVSVPMG